MSKVKHYEQRKDYHLITLSFPATPDELIEYAEAVKAYYRGEDQEAKIKLDKSDKWIVASFCMGVGLTGGNAR